MIPTMILVGLVLGRWWRVRAGRRGCRLAGAPRAHGPPGLTEGGALVLGPGGGQRRRRRARPPRGPARLPVPRPTRPARGRHLRRRGSAAAPCTSDGGPHRDSAVVVRVLGLPLEALPGAEERLELGLDVRRRDEQQLVERLEGVVAARGDGCPSRMMPISTVFAGKGTSPTRDPAYGLPTGSVISTIIALPCWNSKIRTRSPTLTASSTRAVRSRGVDTATSTPHASSNSHSFLGSLTRRRRAARRTRSSRAARPRG